MKSSRILAASAAALALVACTPKAHISGTVADAPGSEIVVRQLNGNVYNTLDTLKADQNGAFRYSVEVEKGQPEFFYLFRGDVRIASLLLEAGEKAVVKADTLGNYTVEGSEGSALLREADLQTADFIRKINAAETQQELVKNYVDYYRERVKFVLSNPYSLASVPVLLEQLDANTPVFSQSTDALHFRATADSLATVYPDSKYVKALRKEAERRENVLELGMRMNDASVLNYPELNLPDVNGRKVSLNGVDAKVVMVHFWNPEDPTHKMLNNEVLLPVYKEYHDKGFEIYAVAVDADKASWASVVRAQNLPWINVNDGLATSSPALVTYNVAQIPATFLATADGITTPSINGAAGLRAELAKLLK